ncbi:MAG: acyl-CoA thioesterase, partial [Desulfomonilaceae bacterium]
MISLLLRQPPFFKDVLRLFDVDYKRALERIVQIKKNRDKTMGSTYRTQITVRFRDLDAMGHVNNAVFFTYFEIGREAFWFDKVSGHVDKTRSYFILARISCDFMRPISFGTQLTLTLAVKNIGSKSFGYLYKLSDSVDESIEYARGESVQVCYDYSQNKSVAISPEFRAILLEFC